jgi:hypothetical protein
MEKSKDELVIDVISDLKSLMGALKVQYPDDLKIKQICNRVNILIDTDPVLVVNKVGGELVKNADKIYGLETTDNLTLYINQNFKINAKSADVADYAHYILLRINIYISEVPEAKCKKYIEKIINMLHTYISYLNLS